MLKVFCPSNGKKLEVNLNKVGKKFFWCNCENPSLQDLKKISKETRIDIKDLKTYTHQKNSKITIRKNYDVMMLKYPVYKSGKITLNNLELIYSKTFVVSIYDNGIDTISDLTMNIGTELIGIKNADYFYFLHRILTALVKHFLTILDRIEFNLDKTEGDLFKPKIGIDVVFYIRKNLLQVRKALVADRNVLVDLQQGVSKYISLDIMHDVYNNIIKILEDEELLRGRLTNMLEVHLSYVSNKMNDLMKSLTVIATALLIPMLVSSIYGMNIRLPIQEHPYAFYTVMFISLLSIILALLYFKMKKWF